MLRAPLPDACPCRGIVGHLPGIAVQLGPTLFLHLSLGLSLGERFLGHGIVSEQVVDFPFHGTRPEEVEIGQCRDGPLPLPGREGVGHTVSSRIGGEIFEIPSEEPAAVERQESVALGHADMEVILRGGEPVGEGLVVEGEGSVHVATQDLPEGTQEGRHLLLVVEGG